MRPNDYDRFHPVSTELAVVKWGPQWRVYDRIGEAEIGPAHPSRMVAIADALRRIAQGDYR